MAAMTDTIMKLETFEDYEEALASDDCRVTQMHFEKSEAVF
jgi:hypothetical protein